MAVKQVEEHSTFHNKIIGTALLESVRKLNPLVMKSNPVLFVVEMGTVLILLMILFPHYFGTENQIGWNTGVFLVLLFTVLFANFAEALAEGRGKAQADTLRRAKRDTEAKRLKADGGIHVVSAEELRRGDLVLVETGDFISLQKPLHVECRECMVTTSIGISIFPRDGEDAQTLMKHADAAMYSAKEKGRNRYIVYSFTMSNHASECLAMEQELHKALYCTDWRVGAANSL